MAAGCNRAGYLMAEIEDAAALGELGNVQRTRGDLMAALMSYRASQGMLDRLSRADPQNAARQRQLAVSHSRIGDVQREWRDLTAALKSYRASHTIFDSLAKADPGDTERLRDLSVSHDRIADLQVDSATWRLRWLATGPRSLSPIVWARWSLETWPRSAICSVSHNKIGDVQACPRRPGSGADEATRPRSRLLTAWPRRNPDNAGGSVISRSRTARSATCDVRRANWRRRWRATGLAEIFERLAEADPATPGGSAIFGLAREDRRRAARAGRPGGGADELPGLARDQRPAGEGGPGQRRWQRDLSVTHDRIGDVQVAQGDLAAALTSYQASLAIADRLARGGPRKRRRGSAISWCRTTRSATCSARRANCTAALTSYREASLGIADRLAMADPRQRRLAARSVGLARQDRRRAARAGRSGGGADVLPGGA